MAGKHGAHERDGKRNSKEILSHYDGKNGVIIFERERGKESKKIINKKNNK